MKFSVLVLLLLGIAGCSYPVKPDMRAANTTSNEKVPGTWKLSISEDVAALFGNVVPYSQHCSGMNYPIAVGQPLSESIERTMSSLFEKIDRADDKEVAGGVVSVELERFNARVGCFAFLRCVANSELALRVTAKDLNRNILVEKSIRHSAEQSGLEGLACEGVATVLSKTISQNIWDSMQDVQATLSESTRSLRK